MASTATDPYFGIFRLDESRSTPEQPVYAVYEVRQTYQQCYDDLTWWLKAVPAGLFVAKARLDDRDNIVPDPAYVPLQYKSRADQDAWFARRPKAPPKPACGPDCPVCEEAKAADAARTAGETKLDAAMDALEAVLNRKGDRDAWARGFAGGFPSGFSDGRGGREPDVSPATDDVWCQGYDAGYDAGYAAGHKGGVLSAKPAEKKPAPALTWDDGFADGKKRGRRYVTAEGDPVDPRSTDSIYMNGFLEGYAAGRAGGLADEGDEDHDEDEPKILKTIGEVRAAIRGGAGVKTFLWLGEDEGPGPLVKVDPEAALNALDRDGYRDDTPCSVELDTNRVVYLTDVF